MHDCLRRYSPLGFTIFTEGDAGAPGDGGTPPAGGAPQDNGFPAGTPVDDMTTEQQVAYWKFHSRKHERVAESRKDFEKYKTDSAELATLKAANQTDHEKALDEARRQGENLGAERYLDVAVEGHLIGATGKTAEDVRKALAFVDVTKFLDDKGDLDASRIADFAASLGTSAAKEEPKPPVGGAIRRELRQAGGVQPKTTSGSIAERVKARKAELTKSTSTQ